MFLKYTLILENKFKRAIKAFDGIFHAGKSVSCNGSSVALPADRVYAPFINIYNRGQDGFQF